MSNSALICYSKISPNRSSPRNHVIDTITIHCMAGQLSVETCGNVFAPRARQASSNYGIGPDGRIGMYVEERDRSWCSSSAANDNRAVTIEVASDPKSPYAVTDAAYEALIRLCADICKRNGIKKLIWSTKKSDRVNHLNGCNMTVHRDYSAKSCPGDYLYNRHGDIANRVNLLLAAGSGGSGNTQYVGRGIGAATVLDPTGMEVRTAARVSAASIGHVKKGEKVEVLQILASGWMKIVWPGAEKGYGYTSNAGGKYYAYQPNNAEKVIGHGVVVNCNLLNVRTSPGVPKKGEPSNILTEWKKLGYGNEVDVLGIGTAPDGSAWYKIRIAAKYIGYVDARYLKVT